MHEARMRTILAVASNRKKKKKKETDARIVVGVVFPVGINKAGDEEGRKAVRVLCIHPLFAHPPFPLFSFLQGGGFWFFRGGDWAQS